MFIECILCVQGPLLDAVGHVKNKSDLFERGTSILTGAAVRDALRMLWKES